MNVNEKLDRAVSDFMAGTTAGASKANERWIEFLTKERTEAAEAMADADPLADEITETPTYLQGWFDAIDYLIHREARFESKP